MLSVRIVFLQLAILLTLSIVITWLERESFFRSIANLWIVSDQLTQADAIVILGGHPTIRPTVAASLYNKRFANKILISRVADELSPTAMAERIDSNKIALLKLGIPDSSIETFGSANKNTRDEAVALKNWAEENNPSALIIPAEIFYARRVSWIFQRAFSGKPVRIEVAAFEPADYNRAEWWKTEGGLLEFRNEVAKYLYYRLKY
jgi:hypothetical protein